MKQVYIVSLLIAFSTCIQTEINLKNWQSNFQDKLLWDIVLPGTHDSCTYRFAVNFPYFVT